MSTDKLPWPRCEMDGCDHLADYWFEVQWTWFDFFDPHVCFDHLYEAYELLAERLVDGQRPSIVTHPFENLNGLFAERSDNLLRWPHDR